MFYSWKFVVYSWKFVFFNRLQIPILGTSELQIRWNGESVKIREIRFR